MNKTLASAALAMILAATAHAWIAAETIAVPAGTTNAVTPLIDIGDRLVTIREIDHLELYVYQPDTNASMTVTLYEETAQTNALTNAICSATFAGSPSITATAINPLRTVNALAVYGAATNAVQHARPYACQRAFFAYSFAHATNSLQAVACTNGVVWSYRIINR